MMDKVVCSGCKVEYTDVKVVEKVKKWITDGYAPCPNIDCTGEFVVVSNDA